MNLFILLLKKQQAFNEPAVSQVDLPTVKLSMTGLHVTGPMTGLAGLHASCNRLHAM